MPCGLEDSEVPGEGGTSGCAKGKGVGMRTAAGPHSGLQWAEVAVVMTESFPLSTVGTWACLSWRSGPTTVSLGFCVPREELRRGLD